MTVTIHHDDYSRRVVPAICTFYGVCAGSAVTPYADAAPDAIEAAWRDTPADLQRKIEPIVAAARRGEDVTAAQAQILAARGAERERQSLLRVLFDAATALQARASAAWDRAHDLVDRIAQAERSRDEFVALTAGLASYADYAICANPVAYGRIVEDSVADVEGGGDPLSGDARADAIGRAYVEGELARLRQAAAGLTTERREAAVAAERIAREAGAAWTRLRLAAGASDGQGVALVNGDVLVLDRA